MSTQPSRRHVVVDPEQVVRVVAPLDRRQPVEGRAGIGGADALRPLVADANRSLSNGTRRYDERAGAIMTGAEEKTARSPEEGAPYEFKRTSSQVEFLRVLVAGTCSERKPVPPGEIDRDPAQAEGRQRRVVEAESEGAVGAARGRFVACGFAGKRVAKRAHGRCDAAPAVTRYPCHSHLQSLSDSLPRLPFACRDRLLREVGEPAQPHASLVFFAAQPSFYCNAQIDAMAGCR